MRLPGWNSQEEKVRWQLKTSNSIKQYAKVESVNHQVLTDYRESTSLSTRSNRIVEIGSIAFIAIGIILALFNFFYNRSLWVDEAMLSLNIVDRSFLELLEPLDMAQVAPIGFLWVEKVFTLIFGDHDWALRIFPLMAFLASIPLFFDLNLKATNARTFAFISTALFSLSTYLIKYASEVKQYSVDVLVCVAILWSALYFLKNRSRSSAVYLALIGAVSVWFSNVSIIVLFAAGLYVFFQIFLRDRNKIGSAILPILAWVVSFGVYYPLFIMDHPTREIMVTFWAEQGAFIESNIFSASFYTSVGHKVYELARLMSFGPFSFVPIIVMLSGILSLIVFGKYRLLYLAVFPILVHFGLSYLSLYPFHIRTILYLSPLVVVLYVAGFYYIFDFIQKRFPRLPSALLLLPFLLQLYPIYLTTPAELEEVKVTMSFMNEHVDPSDQIYVYFGSTPPFDFYKEQYPNINSNAQIIYGELNREDWSAHDDQLRRIEGDVWVLFSHVYRKGGNPEQGEDTYILDRLKEANREVVLQKEATGTSVYHLEKAPAFAEPEMPASGE